MNGPIQTRWRATVLAVCVLAAVVATWPLVLHASSAVPLGTETAATVPVFDIWTLWWSGGRLWHGYADFWNAPIFHPTLGSFAFSEPMILPGIVGAPLFALHAPPALAHNAVLLAMLTANGVLGCRLARALGVTRSSALLSGTLVITLPFFAKMQGELPIVAASGTLAALDGAVRFGRGGRLEHACAVAAGLIAQALCCEQLTPYAALFVAAAALVALHERRFARVALLRLGGAVAVAVVTLCVLARAPLSVHQELGFQRSAELVQSLSATLSDFLSRPRTALLAFPPREAPDSFTGGLFPGIGLLLLASIAVFQRSAKTADSSHRWRWYALAASITGYALALGLNLSLAGWQPFSWLRVLPGFDEIRSPFRAALFGELHLVCLAAFGMDDLARRFGALRPQLALAAGLLTAAENLSVPAPLLAVPSSPRTPWTTFIASQPAGTVLAHVPFPPGREVEDFAPEAWRLFAQIDHGRPLVNGYSSNFPATYREFMFAMADAFPKPILACALHEIFGADLLVVDQPWLATHRAAFGDVLPLLTPAYADASMAIFRFTPPAEACPPMRLEIGH